MPVIRYVFYRIYQQQIRVVRLHGEAAIFTIMYMAIGPQMIVLMADMTFAHMSDGPSLNDVLGKWAFVVGTYAIMFLWHWWILVRGGKGEQIRRYYEANHPYNTRSMLYAHLYIFAPAICAIALAKYLSPQ